MICLVSLINDISTFVGYLMLKPSFSKNISNSICLKVSVIAQLEFEHASYNLHHEDTPID